MIGQFDIGGVSRRQRVVDYFDYLYSIVVIVYAYSTSSYVKCFTPSRIVTIIKHQSKMHDAAITTATMKINALQPESNPYANPDTVSISGVTYQHVFNGLKILYPPNTLDKRNAMSRTDAYWPYIQKGLEPPTELTYGEFDFYFFAQLLDRAILLLDENMVQPTYSSNNGLGHQKQKIFCDIGSGTGRLVFAAAALHPQLFQLCRGVELLPSLHNAAIDHLHQCCYDQSFSFNEQQQQLSQQLQPSSEIEHNSLHPKVTKYALPSFDSAGNDASYPMAPIQFDCGSFDDPYNIYYGDADIIFIFSSCMGSDLVQNKLVQALGRQCQIGTIIITTDYMLPLDGYIPPNDLDDRIPFGNYRLKLLESVDGWCWLTGGASTAYIHRVEQSLQQSGKIEPLELTLQDKALDVVRALESGKLSDPKTFVRNVRNNMIFNGFPECLLPKLRDSG